MTVVFLKWNGENEACEVTQNNSDGDEVHVCMSLYTEMADAEISDISGMHWFAVVVFISAVWDC